MGLNPSPHNPCLISGVITNPSYPACTSDLQSKLHVRFYVVKFVFYLSDPDQGEPLKILLQEQIQVEFMGNVDYFLGTAFNWIQHADGTISVHLCQSSFIEFNTHQFQSIQQTRLPT